MMHGYAIAAEPSTLDGLLINRPGGVIWVSNPQAVLFKRSSDWLFGWTGCAMDGARQVPPGWSDWYACGDQLH